MEIPKMVELLKFAKLINVKTALYINLSEFMWPKRNDSTEADTDWYNISVCLLNILIKPVVINV